MALTGDYQPSASGRVREHVEQIVRTGTTDGVTISGLPTVLMTHRGAKTGEVRKTPVMRVEHEGRYAAFASKGGAPTNPQWYASLVAERLIELQDGTVTRQCWAREVSGDEKALWWRRAVDASPDYVGHQRKTSRQIPVFVLEPVSGGTPAGDGTEGWFVRASSRLRRNHRGGKRSAAVTETGTMTAAMSRNEIEILRARERTAGPTALTVLKDAVADHGEVTDADRRRAAELTGLPEATVYGISSFYDDLTEPRGRRHVSVCTGTACWACDFGEHVETATRELRLELGERSTDGALSLGKTVCLGFCHTAAAVRDGEVVDAGAGSVERLAAGACVAAPEPQPSSMLAEPVLLAEGRFDGLRRALAELSPVELLERVKAAELRGRGGAGFPAGTKWEFARNADGPEKAIIVNGDEGDPGSYIDKYLMEQRPELLLEGMALAGYAVGAGRGFVFVRSEYPRSLPILTAAVERALAAGDLGPDIHGSGFAFEVEVLEGAGSYVVGEETALLASLQGLRGVVSARPPFPAERGWHGKPTVVNNVETLCNVPLIAREGADAFAALSPGASAGSKLVCLNERFRSPGVHEVRFGTPLRVICDELGGGLRDGHEIKALQIGGPLGGILPASLLDTAFDFDSLAEHGCMVGHGSIVAFDERTEIRALAVHLLEFGVDESCGKCFPCRIGLRRAQEMAERPGTIDRDSLEALLETLELGSLCAHGGGMPAPIRSLIEHFGSELGVSDPAGPTDLDQDETIQRPEERATSEPTEPMEEGP